MPPWYPLMGEHELTIDEKGRLLIPSDIRRRLETFGESSELILANLGGRGFLYPEKFHVARLAHLRTSAVPGVQEQDRLRRTFATAVRLEWDKQGRILLSPKTIATYKLDREISLLCVGDHLELWNRQDWMAEQLRLQEQMSESVDSWTEKKDQSDETH